EIKSCWTSISNGTVQRELLSLALRKDITQALKICRNRRRFETSKAEVLLVHLARKAIQECCRIRDNRIRFARITIFDKLREYLSVIFLKQILRTSPETLVQRSEER
ncbi:hypothetical protein NPIL_134021, partial [Nephila pilipes]